MVLGTHSPDNTAFWSHHMMPPIPSVRLVLTGTRSSLKPPSYRPSETHTKPPSYTSSETHKPSETLLRTALKPHHLWVCGRVHIYLETLKQLLRSWTTTFLILPSSWQEILLTFNTMQVIITKLIIIQKHRIVLLNRLTVHRLIILH